MSANPQMMALRFRVWQFCSARHWEVTVSEVSDGLGDLSPQQVSGILQGKGWLRRVRTDRRRDQGTGVQFKRSAPRFFELELARAHATGRLGAGDVA